MDIIDRIEKIMNMLNFKQNELAYELNITPQALSKLLQKKSKPSSDTLIQLCKLCKKNNIDMQWLMTGENETIINLSELEEELLKYFRAIPEREQLRYIGKLEDAAEPYLQETKLSTLKSG